MLPVAQDYTDLVGRTPLLALNRLFPDSSARILAKLELFNPMSIKDRAVLNMIRGAVQKGLIRPETEVVEATSGNAGIAIASLGAVFGFRVRLYMSELCSIERQKILCAYGARVVITPAEGHTREARERALAYCRANPRTTFFLNQHENPDNGGAHEKTTGPELWEQTRGNLDAVVIGLGTSGTFDGISRFLKARKPEIRIIGFEPAASPVYSGGTHGEHHIIGIGPGFVTENFRRSQHNMDEIMLVSDETAYAWARSIARKEGLLVGPSSGAAASVAGQVALREDFKGKTIVCFFYDTGERYLSTPDLFLLDNVEKDPSPPA